MNAERVSRDELPAPEDAGQCERWCYLADGHEGDCKSEPDDDPYPDRVMVDASGKPFYEP
jgi:hypothetical protein